ncbi:hypothetical protein OSTOST_24080 [Ostertagia ostertagi]
MSARGKVSQRSAPKQNVSQRTSSRSAPAPPSERSAPSQPPGAAPGSAPKQNVSQRTSSRSAPAPPSERSAPSQPPGAAPGEEQDTATKILTTIQNILTGSDLTKGEDAPWARRTQPAARR